MHIVALSKCLLGWTNLDFVSYDISKCFDSLPWQSVQNALWACGFHAETVRALRASWESVHRFWKLHGRVQMSTVSPANGLLQGDPTAPACLAAWMVEPVRHINRVWPSVEVSQFVDDMLLASEDVVALHEAHQYLENWVRGLPAITYSLVVSTS